MLSLEKLMMRISMVNPICLIFPLLFVLLFSAAGNAQFSPERDQENKERTSNIDEVAAACQRAAKKDQICTALVELKQIGDDSIEIIKTYIVLTPAEYSALTLLNMLATGRFRIRTKSYFLKGANDILDFKRDSTTFLIEKDF